MNRKAKAGLALLGTAAVVAMIPAITNTLAYTDTKKYIQSTESRRGTEQACYIASLTESTISNPLSNVFIYGSKKAAKNYLTEACGR